MNLKKIDRDANKKYQSTLDNIIYPLLGYSITFSNDLKRIGMKLFGTKFCGVFSSDQIPILNKDSKYAIINLDNSDEPGSHWIAIAFDEDLDRILVYDSFGRQTREIIPSIFNKYRVDKVVMTDDDAEQNPILDNDCGARSMAWLFVFDRYGYKVAKLI